MSGSRFHFAMSRICRMNVASTSATKWCGSGGTFWSTLRRGNPKKTGQSAAILFKLAVASGRDFREDQRRDALSVACRRPLGEVLESYVTKRRDRKAALKFPRKTMKKCCNPEIIMTDKLRTYGAAKKVIGNASPRETGRWQNNRAENSHLPFSTPRTGDAPLSADA